MCMIHVVGLDGWRQIPSNPGINSTRPSPAQWAGSVVSIATGYGLEGPGIESRWGRNFPHLSKPALGPTQPPVQWVTGLFPGEKSGRGVALTTHPPSSAEVEERVDLYLYCFSGPSWPVNLQEPCVLHIGRAYRYPPDVAFYIFFCNKYKF